VHGERVKFSSVYRL